MTDRQGRGVDLCKWSESRRDGMDAESTRPKGHVAWFPIRGAVLRL